MALKFAAFAMVLLAVQALARPTPDTTTDDPCERFFGNLDKFDARLKNIKSIKASANNCNALTISHNSRERTCITHCIVNVEVKEDDVVTRVDTHLVQGKFNIDDSENNFYLTGLYKSECDNVKMC